MRDSPDVALPVGLHYLAPLGKLGPLGMLPLIGEITCMLFVSSLRFSFFTNSGAMYFSIRGHLPPSSVALFKARSSPLATPFP